MEAPLAAIETVVQTEELRQLIEVGELTGAIRSSDLAEVLDPHALDPLELEAVYRVLEERGIEVVEVGDERESPTPPPLPPASSLESTTDALQLFLRETGRHSLLTAAAGGRAGEEDRAGRRRWPSSR